MIGIKEVDIEQVRVCLEQRAPQYTARDNQLGEGQLIGISELKYIHTFRKQPEEPSIPRYMWWRRPQDHRPQDQQWRRPKDQQWRRPKDQQWRRPKDEQW